MVVRLESYSYAVVPAANSCKNKGFTVLRRSTVGECFLPEMMVLDARYPLSWGSLQCAWSWIDRGMAEKHPWWSPCGTL